MSSPDAVDRNATANTVKRIKATPVPSGDQVDRNRAARQQQIAKSKSVSPDRQDTKRSPAQLKRDAQVVATNVGESRRKVIRRQGAGSITRAVKRELEGKGVIAKGVSSYANMTARAIDPAAKVQTGKASTTYVPNSLPSK
ncbi:MAG TPA: hypothetical protein VI300_15600, partial [Solirubrobacter sp.]